MRGSWSTVCSSSSNLISSGLLGSTCWGLDDELSCGLSSSTIWISSGLCADGELGFWGVSCMTDASYRTCRWAENHHSGRRLHRRPIRGGEPSLSFWISSLRNLFRLNRSLRFPYRSMDRGQSCDRKMRVEGSCESKRSKKINWNRAGLSTRDSLRTLYSRIW